MEIFERLFGKLPAKVTRMIKLPDDEKILFHLRLFPFISVIKNGKKEIRTFLIITTKKVVLIDYLYFHEDLRVQDVIFINEIACIDEEMKQMYVDKEPIIKISTTQKETYELSFLKIFETHKKHRAKITEIIKSQVGTSNNNSRAIQAHNQEAADGLR